MTHKLKGNPIFHPQLLNEMPNFPYYIREEENLGIHFIQAIIDIHIPEVNFGEISFLFPFIYVFI